MSESRGFGRRLAIAVEGAGALLLYWLFRLMPVRWASATGGFLARRIGPFLSVDSRARRNLQRSIPEIDDAAARRIITGMWDNLGRVTAEYAHLDCYRAYQPGGRLDIVGAENIYAQRDSGKPAIFFSGHFGNWELAMLAIALAGLAVTGVYRAANNPIVDDIMNRARRARRMEHSDLIPKGATGARLTLAALHQGRHLAMLVDQKMNDGIAVPFFGRDAMTAPALARLALRFGCAVVPIRVDRLPHSYFRITAEAPLQYTPTGNAQADTLALTTQVNQVLERWIRERPDHWFWAHRRWPD